MVDRNLLREFNVSDDELDLTFQDLVGDEGEWDVELMYTIGGNFNQGQILPGVVLRKEGDDILVDVGYKSEGIVPAHEWEEGEPAPFPGQQIEVLLEEIEGAQGLILLSRRKAKRIRDWERVTSSHKEGDLVSGKVLRKIKGGLLVDIGVNVFLPASQVDIRRPSDIADYIDQDIECMILKIDEGRRNIVVSRRKLIEITREQQKKQLLAEIEPGQVRTGTVKNIADFGAFVDLGGIDGLLHITDMSWGRINHPSDMVKIDDQIE